MLLEFKRINFEYLIFISLAILAGVLISFYSLSALFILLSILFIAVSFKYFNQVLLALIFYLPFQVALNVSTGIDLASGRVLILYLFLVWILKSLAEKRLVVRFNLQTLLIGLFLFLAAFSILQAWDIERALRKILVFLSVFPLYFIVTSPSLPSSLNKAGVRRWFAFVVANGTNNEKHISKILSALIAGGFILSLIGVVQFVLQFFIGIDPLIIFWSKYISPLFYGNTFGAEVVSNPSWLVNINGATVLRAFSLFPDPHMFSFYLGLLIPIVLAIALTGKKDTFFNNKLLHFVLIAMLLAELLTFSRGGYLGMIAGIGMTIILLWRRISFRKKITLGLISAMAIIFLLTTSQSIVNRFLSSFDFKEGSNTERLKNWNQGHEMFADNFFFGVGIGNYSLKINPTIEYRAPVYAHNLYLDIGAEMGIFALVVWIFLISVTMFQLYKAGKNGNSEFLKIISTGLIGSLLWFSAHGFFDTPIYSPTILAVFVIIISVAVMLLTEKNKNKI